MTGYVYVMNRAPGGGLKIGRSSQPFRRLDQLRRQGAKEILAVVAHWNENAVERAAHEVLAVHRLDGEWFDVPLTLAVQAISQAVSKVDAEMPIVSPAPTLPSREGAPFQLGYVREFPGVSAVEQEQWLLASGVDPLDVWRDRELSGALRDVQEGDNFLVWSRDVFPYPVDAIGALWDRGATLVMKE